MIKLKVAGKWVSGLTLGIGVVMGAGAQVVPLVVGQSLALPAVGPGAYIKIKSAESRLLLRGANWIPQPLGYDSAVCLYPEEYSVRGMMNHLGWVPILDPGAIMETPLKYNGCDENLGEDPNNIKFPVQSYTVSSGQISGFDVDASLFELVAIRGIKSTGFSVKRLSMWSKGGAFSLKNINVPLKSWDVSADFAGHTFGTPTVPSVSYVSSGMNAFRYLDRTVPGSIPWSALKVGGDPSGALKAAGYQFQGTANGELTFSGAYRVKYIYFTDAAKKLIFDSIGASQYAISAFNSNAAKDNPGGPVPFADLTVTVTYTAPWPLK